MKNKLILAVIILIIVATGAGLYFFLPKDKKTKIDENEFIDLRYSTEPTGIYFIQKDLDEGKIDLDTALIYKVKFLFNDPTMPKEYNTENKPFEDEGTFAEINENWNNFSAETKKILEPYFFRPDNPQSFISKLLNGEVSSTQTSWFKIKQASAFDRPFSYKSDEKLITDDGKIKVWYLEKKEVINGEEKITKIYYNIAQKIVANLNTNQAYAQFVGLLGKIPPSDGILGGDDKTDIYIGPSGFDQLGTAYGVNVPDNGNGRSSFIIINSNLDDRNIKTTTVHELFHAFQRAFDCWLYKKNWWWIEGTATWSEDFIYPKENTEQGWVGNFISKSETSLFKNGENFEYGAYVFPFYLSNTYDRMVITKIFEGCQGNGDPLISAEKTIDGGFKKNWKEFTLWNYNQKPIENYKNSDQSKIFPSDSSESSSNSETNFISGLGELSYSTKDLVPLSAQVITFPIMNQDNEIRKMTFKDLKNFTSKTDKAAIKAIIYPKNGATYIEDWTETEKRSFCFDKSDENLEKVVLIFSNAEIKEKIIDAEIKIKNVDTCYAIDQAETMEIKPIFALTAGYVGTLKYKAEGRLIKDSVPAKAKYPYLGKWEIKVNYFETFPPQGLYGISASKMDFAYDHILEFDLSADSVISDGTFEIKTKNGDFKTPGWDVYNEISGDVVNIPKTEMDWSVVQKGVITGMTEDGCKISMPEFVLYNSGGYRELPHSIIFEIINN